MYIRADIQEPAENTGMYCHTNLYTVQQRLHSKPSSIIFEREGWPMTIRVGIGWPAHRKWRGRRARHSWMMHCVSSCLMCCFYYYIILYVLHYWASPRLCIPLGASVKVKCIGATIHHWARILGLMGGGPLKETEKPPAIHAKTYRGFRNYWFFPCCYLTAIRPLLIEMSRHGMKETPVTS